ncbi:MAG: hypothetical protein IJX80_04450, partial [Clostridia bacterium]|nr:hypothetical protein [Clostridia bacterium]
LHSLPLISNSGYYSWYNKVPYGFMYCELIEETDAPSSYSITVNDIEYHGIYKESYINNYFGTLGSIKRKYEISDSDKEYFLVEESTDEIVYINLKPIADANDQPVSEQEAFQLGVAFIESQISKSAHLDVRNYRYEGILLSNATHYTLYYKRYINEICVDDQYQASINLSNGKIETFIRLADCSEMEAMSGYIDFDLAKLCADEKVREVTRNCFFVTENEINEPEVHAIRLSSNGAFCMVYEYPIYNPKSKETAYLSILVCVLNPDFER